MSLFRNIWRSTLHQRGRECGAEAQAQHWKCNPENMAVDALCSWIGWRGDRSILEGSGASEVETLGETSPACHFHMHFSRMGDPSPFPLTLGDSHNNNKGSWGPCGILFLSCWGADQCRDMNTDSLPSASVWQNNTSSDLEKGYVKGAQERVAFAWTLSKRRPLVTSIIFFSSINCVYSTRKHPWK